MSSENRREMHARAGNSKTIATTEDGAGYPVCLRAPLCVERFCRSTTNYFWRIRPTCVNYLRDEVLP